MGSTAVTSEITESCEELNPVSYPVGSKTLRIKLKPDDRDGNSFSYDVEDDLDRLLRAIDLRTSARIRDLSSQTGVDMLRKNAALKKPMKTGISQSPRIGISESVTLKQALRKLCITQASEMAAVKRLTKPTGVSGVSEAGTIKRLYASVVVPSGDPPSHSLDEPKGDLVEISIVPEKILYDLTTGKTKLGETNNCSSSSQSAVSSPRVVTSNKSSLSKIRILDVIKNTSAETSENLSAHSDIVKKDTATSKPSISGSPLATASSKPIVTPRLVKPVLRNKTTVKKKGKKEAALVSGNSPRCKEVSKSASIPGKNKSFPKKETVSGAFSNASPTNTVNVKNIEVDMGKPASSPNDCGVKAVATKMIERSREKGECSQSSKSSIGDYSSSTSISDDSHQSVGSTNGSRPHMSKDIRWVAIRQTLNHQGSLGLKNFKLLKRLGCGDIGTVYLAELVGTECLFALKVMDIDFLVSRKKMLRAQTEREILQMLDHPFLPTLYSHFTSDNLSCLVMEYCPGGDLHVLRQKQPGRNFSEPAARFYVAEVLLALEYLHMLGVIYRDLKPENILVREDGHIMLSDFDLSLRCSVNPTLLRSSSLGINEAPKKLYGPCTENSCIDPLCLQPSWVQVSCFTPRLACSTETKTRKVKTDVNGPSNLLPQLVVEPTDARSNSFVGTHEYLAPEIIRGDGHGSAVDWWTLGIFLYELLFGRTPFKGPGNEETLGNVVYQSLRFPDNMTVSAHARDLIKGLLSKDPECRLGYVKGAAEIKQHPFFEGLNWALIRCAAPPETPRSFDDIGTPVVIRKKKEGRCLDFRSNGEDVEFELF